MNLNSSPALRIGPSGWLHPDWKGTVYPRGVNRGVHPLEFLSRVVDTVEIDLSARHPVRPELARAWANRVAGNPRFQFTALLDHRFTYQRDLSPEPASEWSRGISALQDAGRLGAVVMQFPWAFRYSQENREFLIRVRRAFHMFPLVAEFRHESWSREEAAGTLIDYRIGLVNLDQPEYARALRATALLTSPVAYVRLLGRDGREAAQAFSEGPALPPYLYSEAELNEWRPRIARLAAHAERTFVVLANSAAGRSMVNALQLQTIFGESRSVPADLMARYRRPLAGYARRLVA